LKRVSLDKTPYGETAEFSIAIMFSPLIKHPYGAFRYPIELFHTSLILSSMKRRDF